MPVRWIPNTEVRRVKPGGLHLPHPMHIGSLRRCDWGGGWGPGCDLRFESGVCLTSQYNAIGAHMAPAGAFSLVCMAKLMPIWHRRPLAMVRVVRCKAHRKYTGVYMIPT